MKRRSLLVLLCESLLAFASIATVFHLWVGVRNPVGLVVVDGLAAAKDALGCLVAPGPVQSLGAGFAVAAVWGAAVVLGPRPLRTSAWAPVASALAGVVSLLAVVGLLAWILPAAGLAPVAFLFCVIAMSTLLTHFAEARTAGPVPDGLWPLQWGIVGAGMASLAWAGAPLLGDTAVPGFVDAALGWLPDTLVVRRIADVAAIAAACFASAALLDKGVPLLPRASAGPARLTLALGHLAIIATIVASPALLLEAWPCPPARAGGVVGVASEVVEFGDPAERWVTLGGERVYVGAGHKLEADGAVFVSRFQEGRVVRFDPATGRAADLLHAGWGAGPLAASGGALHAATAGGWVVEFPFDGSEPRRHRAAGVTDLKLGPGVRADGRCGTHNIGG